MSCVQSRVRCKLPSAPTLRTEVPSAAAAARGTSKARQAGRLCGLHATQKYDGKYDCWFCTKPSWLTEVQSPRWQTTVSSKLDNTSYHHSHAAMRIDTAARMAQCANIRAPNAWNQISLNLGIWSGQDWVWSKGRSCSSPLASCILSLKYLAGFQVCAVNALRAVLLQIWSELVIPVEAMLVTIAWWQACLAMVC